VLSDPARPPAETAGQTSKAPAEKATAIRIQFSMKKLTGTPFE
jgi:hypothetical protein